MGTVTLCQANTVFLLMQAVQSVNNPLPIFVASIFWHGQNSCFGKILQMIREGGKVFRLRCGSILNGSHESFPQKVVGRTRHKDL